MATAHYKQPWVLRSNPEFLMCNWKPPQMINNGIAGTPISRRVFQTPRDGAPGFLTENTRSFLSPKYTYYASSLDTMNPPTRNPPPASFAPHTATPQTPVPNQSPFIDTLLEEQHNARHQSEADRGNPRAPQGTAPRTSAPHSHGQGFGQSSGVPNRTGNKRPRGVGDEHFFRESQHARIPPHTNVRFNVVEDQRRPATRIPQDRPRSSAAPMSVGVGQKRELPRDHSHPTARPSQRSAHNNFSL